MSGTMAIRLARRIKTVLANLSFGTSLTRSNLPHRESWYHRSDNWHIKQ